MNEPVIELPVDDILERFEHGGRWIQHSWSNEDGECLHSGIRACMPRKGDAYLIEEVAARQGWGTAWNDTPGLVFDDVKRAVVEHREILPHEMLATFGPQWEQIAVFVRHVAELSSDEFHRIAAAWDAAWGTARAAARDAAGCAAWGTARAAARDAAGCAAWGTARDAARNTVGNAAKDFAWDPARDAAGSAAIAAARDAAVALSVRDLIDPNGFTREHYDTLTAPWASVIGKVHPDDQDLQG